MGKMGEATLAEGENKREVVFNESVSVDANDIERARTTALIINYS
jgi:hypothetical protein